MIEIRNKAAQTTPVAIPAAGAVVPFDTVVYTTNDLVTLSDNALSLLTPGAYSTACSAVLTNSGSADVTVSLAAYADGTAIPGASATLTVPAAGQATLTLPWILRVISAATGTADISWQISGGAVSLTNAYAQVWRMV